MTRKTARHAVQLKSFPLCNLLTYSIPFAIHVLIQKKKHKNIGFLSNTGPDPLKMTKSLIIIISQHSLLGNHRQASETPFNWRFIGVPIMARLFWYLDPPPPN